MTAADFAIKTFGGVRALARAINRTPTCVYLWTVDPTTNHGGTGGRIPSKAQQLILKAAKKQGIKIDPAKLVVGA